MPDILAIVSKAVFERDGKLDDEPVKPGDVWPVDRYTSANKILSGVADGGRLFLVTVRPPNERMWIVGVLEAPSYDGAAWIAPIPNAYPVTDISHLRGEIEFEP
ncbi:MAG: hypothetical protein NT062_37370, partial [Proteobacteria bacterium]|nr:hypothetical protein [Pseudomonadota bacterium]